jgi:Zn-dependent peptidase ImmA (M78 family)
MRETFDKLAVQGVDGKLQHILDEVESLPALPATVRVTTNRPAAAAKELLESACVAGAPVDVEDLARRSGVHVVRCDFTDALSGLKMELASGAVIVVNATRHPVRQRFTIGHELGHYLLAHHDVFHVDLGPSAEHGNPPGYDWRHERAANEFAAGLLMPATVVYESYGSTISTAELADQFEVSQLAMGYRLAALGLR